MKYGNKKLFLPILFVVLLTLLFSTKNSFAQTSSYDVTVSPVFFDLTENPGDIVSDKIRIRNNTSSPIPIKLQIQKITGDLNGNLALKEDPTDPAVTWVRFTKNTLLLPPLEWTDVPFTLSIPKDASYGYYIAISFTQDNSSKFAKTGAKITGAAAIPILLNIRREGAKADAKVLDFKTDSFINNYLPINFTVKVQNLGNIHIRPHGNIFISDGHNKNLAILDVNAEQGNIIPDTARIFNSSWSDGFLLFEPEIIDGQYKLDKNGKPEKHLVINWDKLTSFRIGKYDANLVMVFDNGARDIPIEANLSFWVIPYQIVGIVLIVIIAFVLLIRFVLRRYIKSQLRKQSR